MGSKIASSYMQNKITLQTNPTAVSERSLLNGRNLGRFIYGAEEDYVLARVLLYMSIYDAGMYHYQQCMEKFLKAFLIQNNVQFRNTHNLETLRALCEQRDNFFSDPDLVDACDKVKPFEVVGRYPSELLRSYGWVMPDLAFFLDEFVYEMRGKINRQGIADIIGEMQASGKVTPIDYQSSSVCIVDLFFKKNSFFTRS